MGSFACFYDKYWTALFQDSRVTNGMTSNLLDEYRKKVDALADYDFSLYNIYTIQLEMSKSLTKGIEDCIIELFDELSYQYSYTNEFSENIQFYNGWKTNKCWIINKKVILPFCDAWSFMGRYDQASYKVFKKLSDIEKALDYLNGSVSNERALQESLRAAKKENQTKKIPKTKWHIIPVHKNSKLLQEKRLQRIVRTSIAQEVLEA